VKHQVVHVWEVQYMKSSPHPVQWKQPPPHNTPPQYGSPQLGLQMIPSQAASAGSLVTSATPSPTASVLPRLPRNLRRFCGFSYWIAGSMRTPSLAFRDQQAFCEKQNPPLHEFGRQS
jgi:hypothetical protein